MESEMMVESDHELLKKNQTEILPINVPLRYLECSPFKY